MGPRETSRGPIVATFFGIPEPECRKTPGFSGRKPGAQGREAENPVTFRYSGSGITGNCLRRGTFLRPIRSQKAAKGGTNMPWYVQLIFVTMAMELLFVGAVAVEPTNEYLIAPAIKKVIIVAAICGYLAVILNAFC
jgi:hypothetical protein